MTLHPSLLLVATYMVLMDESPSIKLDQIIEQAQGRLQCPTSGSGRTEVVI
jgi:hypothetical protein